MAAAGILKTHKLQLLGRPLKYLHQFWYGGRHGSAATSADVKFHSLHGQ